MQTNTVKNLLKHITPSEIVALGKEINIEVNYHTISSYRTRKNVTISADMEAQLYMIAMHFATKLFATSTPSLLDVLTGHLMNVYKNAPELFEQNMKEIAQRMRLITICSSKPNKAGDNLDLMAQHFLDDIVEHDLVGLWSQVLNPENSMTKFGSENSMTKP